MQVMDRKTGKCLTPEEILTEVNRDHSSEWVDYTVADLISTPAEVLEWLDPEYFGEVTRGWKGLLI